VSFSNKPEETYKQYVQAMGTARQQVEGRAWDDILIINLGNIIKEVDAALG
jgi:hypothetical protein